MTVHQHWDPLKVCLVGSSYPPEFYSYIKNSKVRNVMERIAIETEEDYQKICDKLAELGVEKTFRTKISDDWEKDHGWGRHAQYPPMTPRDHTAMVGNTWFQPGGEYGRNFDAKHLLSRVMHWKEQDLNEDDEIIAEYVLDLLKPGRNLRGSEAIEALRNSEGESKSVMGILGALDTDELERIAYSACTNVMGSKNRNMHRDFNFYKDAEEWAVQNGHECQYDKYISTANLTRLGKDLYFGLNNVVNYLNRDHFINGWQKLFPGYRVHPITSPGHHDGAFTPVKPGLIISTGHAQDYSETFPGWEIVRLKKDHWQQVKDFRKVKEQNRGRWWVPGEENNDDLADFINTWLEDWVLYVEETVFDVNMLVVDEKNVLCNNYNKEAFDAFERHGVTPHVVNFRHRYFWDGGLHCITSDLHREGTQQDYFPNEVS